MIVKSFKYRVYPTPEQLERLEQWEGALRWLWNIAHEQRLMGLARSNGEKVYVSYYAQQNELTELRAGLPWLADVPRDVCNQVLADLDKAWQRYFKKLSWRPRFKVKGRGHLSFCEPHHKAWRVTETGDFRFPKLGVLNTKLHRPLEGKPSTCTLVRDIDQWFVCIICKVESVPMPRKPGAVAIHHGATLALEDSAGDTVEHPAFLKTGAQQLTRAHRKLARTKKGSNNRAKARERLAKLHRKMRRQRDYFLHNLSSHYAKNHGTVIIEKSEVTNDVGLGRLRAMLRYKLEWNGGQLVEVPAVADTNALKILSRGIHGGAVCGGSALGRPAKQKLYVARRGTPDYV